MKRLLLVAFATLLTAAALAVLSRSGPTGTENGAPPAPLPRFSQAIELDAGAMRPPRIQVPKDHEVHLTIWAGSRSGEGLLTILGYDDVVRPVAIGPGQAREIVFESTRPGTDFALALNGEVLGRLDVTGRHLEEGHQ